MVSRIELHNKFKTILGNNHVYFQPPESLKMEYNAIVYKEDVFRSRYANNKPYNISPGYSVTLITTQSEEDLVLQILALPKCRFDRAFESDNLYHNVFTIFK